MPFYEANTAQTCNFRAAKIGSEFRSMKRIVGRGLLRGAEDTLQTTVTARTHYQILMLRLDHGVCRHLTLNYHRLHRISSGKSFESMSEVL